MIPPMGAGHSAKEDIKRLLVNRALGKGLLDGGDDVGEVNLGVPVNVVVILVGQQRLQRLGIHRQVVEDVHVHALVVQGGDGAVGEGATLFTHGEKHHADASEVHILDILGGIHDAFRHQLQAAKRGGEVEGQEREVFDHDVLLLRRQKVG